MVTGLAFQSSLSVFWVTSEYLLQLTPWKANGTLPLKMNRSWKNTLKPHSNAGRPETSELAAGGRTC